MGRSYLKLHSQPGAAGGGPGNTDQEAASILDGVEHEHGTDSPGNPGDSSGVNIPTAEFLRPAVEMVCSVAFPGKRIDKQHIDMCAESYGELIDYYFPGGIGHPALAALLATAVMWYTYRAPKPEKKPEPAANAAQAAA